MFNQLSCCANKISLLTITSLLAGIKGLRWGVAHICNSKLYLAPPIHYPGYVAVYYIALYALRTSLQTGQESFQFHSWGCNQVRFFFCCYRNLVQ
jgi:hypothetical protein